MSRTDIVEAVKYAHYRAPMKYPKHLIAEAEQLLPVRWVRNSLRRLRNEFCESPFNTDPNSEQTGCTCPSCALLDRVFDTLKDGVEFTPHDDTDYSLSEEERT